MCLIPTFLGLGLWTPMVTNDAQANKRGGVGGSIWMAVTFW